MLEVYLVHDRRECAKFTNSQAKRVPRCKWYSCIVSRAKRQTTNSGTTTNKREIMKICIVYPVREIRVCLAKDAVLLVISESESKITRDAREMQCI